MKDLHNVFLMGMNICNRQNKIDTARKVASITAAFSSSLVSSWRELNSVQSVAGFATNLTTLRKKLSFSDMTRW